MAASLALAAMETSTSVIHDIVVAEPEADLGHSASDVEGGLRRRQLLFGLGFATFTCNMQRHRRWIVHAVIMCQAGRQSNIPAAAADKQVLHMSGAGSSSVGHTASEVEAPSSNAMLPDQQPDASPSTGQGLNTATLYSLMNFSAAPLSTASKAGFKQGESPACLLIHIDPAESI